MGCCTSAEKRDDASMKLRVSIVAKAKRLIMMSEKREKTSNVENGLVELAMKGKKGDSGLSSDGSSRRVQSYGSKDEAFFDSLAWLESDCEDDYFSVKGDFTPSSGNTLNYHGSTPETPRPTLASIVNRMSDVKEQISPTSKKMKLADLFKETKANDEDDADVSLPLESPATKQQKFDGKQSDETNSLPPNSLIPTPVPSEINSTGNVEPDMALKLENRKAAKGSQCCMPNLLPSLSFTEKKMLSVSVPMIENKA